MILMTSCLLPVVNVGLVVIGDLSCSCIWVQLSKKSVFPCWKRANIKQAMRTFVDMSCKNYMDLGHIVNSEMIFCYLSC